MAADHNIQQYQPPAACQQQQQQLQQANLTMAGPLALTALDGDNLERLFPRCRPKQSPVDTAVLIDLSDEPPARVPCVERTDSDASPRRPPSLKLNSLSASRRYCPSKYRAESEMRRGKMRRARTMDPWAISHYDGAGYEPSPDSEEENDSDFIGRTAKAVTGASGAASTSSSSASIRRTGVRSSASESHIVGHWRKNRTSAKEVYDLTPNRVELGSPSAGSASGGGGASIQTDPSRLEIAGGREVVSLSRTRTRASLRKQRQSAAQLAAQLVNSTNNNNSTASSSNRSINRYSGEVYYEESVGRYGFHVGGGNTLWGSQGLEPGFSIANSLNNQGSGGSSHAATPAGPAGSSSSSVSGAKRPLSWAGDELVDPIVSPEANVTVDETLIDAKLPEDRGLNEEQVNCGSFLTDFYPEVVSGCGDPAINQSADQQATGEVNRPLSLDNYLSEQLNQFAQHSARKESNESEENVQQQLGVATVIGGLTIAQYEGSPRRYGIRAHQATSNGQDDLSDDEPKLTNGPSLVAAGPPRSLVPGFPRRVTPCSPQHPQATFSPSATRQTLVDLTVSSAAPHPPPVAASTPSSNRHLSWHLDSSTPVPNSNSTDRIDSLSAADLTDLGETEVGLEVGAKSRNFTLSPETTDYDDSELDIDHGAKIDTSSVHRRNGGEDRRGSNNSGKSHASKGQFSSMPILEDGLSSGGSSSESGDESSLASSRAVSSGSESEDDEEEMVPDPTRVPLMAERHVQPNNQQTSRKKPPALSVHLHSLQSVNNGCRKQGSSKLGAQQAAQSSLWVKKLPANGADCDYVMRNHHVEANSGQGSFRARDATPPPPAPLAHRPPATGVNSSGNSSSGSGAKQATQGTQAAPGYASSSSGSPLRFSSPGLETAGKMASAVGPASLRQQEMGMHELDEALEHERRARKAGSAPPPPTAGVHAALPRSTPVWVPRQGNDYWVKTSPTSASSPSARHHASGSANHPDSKVNAEEDDERETDQLLRDAADDQGFFDDENAGTSGKKKGRSKEVMVHEPAVLIEGVLFRANYLGSTQIVCEGQPTKYTRMMQAEEAVSRIKAPEGETQPTTEVDLFISTEKIMVLNTELKEIMMDHALRTISYIADIGDLVVLMARRRVMSQDGEDASNKIAKTPKMVCHVFESEEAQFIAQSIGQAFQVAYMEFLKANGIEDQSFVREMDYQEVLNSQEIFGDELQMFAKKELQKEVIVPKARNEILGVVIVESGWGSMLPTVVIANLAPAGAAARCGQLNIGDQIIAINGISLVGLPLSTCQGYIKNTKSATVVKLTVVPCPPVVEVKIKRPDTKYQLGFSVQNGVICSLLRGGIAERGGVRVGHRIIEINGQSVVAVPHERIVGLLATSVGEINMKTMPTSMFRLLIGQETPVYI